MGWCICWWWGQGVAEEGMRLKIPGEGRWVMIDNAGEGGRGKSSRAEKAILEMSIFILKLMRSCIVVSTGWDWHGKLHFIIKIIPAVA